MSVVYGLRNVLDKHPECAVAIGVFDGVHWGHRAIFLKLLEIASERNIQSVALTFDRHPAELLSPARAPYYITTLDQRIELIKNLGVDEIVVAEFDSAFAELTKENFVKSVLERVLHAGNVVVGSNFRFGRNRTGDIKYLSRLGDEIGLGVNVVSSVIINGAPVSSTRTRNLIASGDVINAAKLLGRQFTLRGTVVVGKQIGRTIGFPTANIQAAPRQLLPARGVYAVESTIGDNTYSGVCNIGCRPTFGGETVSVEVHLLGFQGNIYGEMLDVAFYRRLRDEMIFESPEKLADQIKKDLEQSSSS